MKTNRQHSPVNALDLHVRSGRATEFAVNERRGSALLIVIGTLALVAVFAAVYISIGRTDRRAARALTERKNQTETSVDFSEYFASIIGDERLGTYVQYDANGEPFARREVTDAPYTDWFRLSETASGNQEARLFTPTGDPYQLDGLAPDSDYRVANDPWLASTLPTYLGEVGLLNSGRPFSGPVFNPSFPNAKNFLDNRDWLQISNFAPDGRPVNLYNLRPTVPEGSYNGLNGADSAVGGFESEPGFGTSPRADGRATRRMSNYLSLFNQANPGDPESLIQAFDPAIDGVWVPGSNTPQPIGVTGADLYNIPAVWTMYQRFMFMPINQPFITLNRNGDVSTWADPDYPPYQYADADGDGFADSRWFELVAARDRNEGNANQRRDDVQWLYNKSDLRYFIAARAVDLSSMVNVNTATDLLVPPTLDHPLGQTPADVDLRRLLTMQDPATDYAAGIGANPSSPAVIPLSLQAIHRPYVSEQSFIVPRTWTAPPRVIDYSRDVTDYNFYQLTSSTNDLLELDADAPSMLIGRYAYDALRRGITQGSSLTDKYFGVNIVAGNSPATGTGLLQYEADPTDFNWPPAQISAEHRFEQYMSTGRLDPTNTDLSWSRSPAGTTNIYGSGLYGIDDLAELLTYHGLNDPEVTSRLEQVMYGRYESPAGAGIDDALQTRRYSPLLSNRPLTLDRDQHGLALEDLTRDPRIPPNLQEPGLREVNGRISFNSMALEALTPRTKLTTVSGFNPIWPDEQLGDSSELSAMTEETIPPLLSDVFSDPKVGFRLYTGALARELDTDNQYWPIDPDQFTNDPTSTLFYGHRGSELALRIAAHAAVNMKDLADEDTKTSVATLVLDPNSRTTLMSAGNVDDPTGDSLYQLYPGAADDNLLDPGEDEIANSALPDKRKAVNVYGMEAMPVITEVSSLYLFTDASEAEGGDPDYGPRPLVRPDGTIIYPAGNDANKEITINGEVLASNPDYLMALLAIQIHNPYDEPISLGGSGDDGVPLVQDAPLTRHRDYDDPDRIDLNSNYQFDYYIEFAGRFYKLAQYIDWYPTDQNSKNYFDLDDPTNTPAFGTVPNNPAQAGSRPSGMFMPPTTESGSYPDFITRNEVLEPHQTRVFYVIADRRFDDPTNTGNPDTPDLKWQRQLAAWGELPNGFLSTAPANDVDGDGLPDGVIDSQGWTGPAEEWVKEQLRVRGGASSNPVLMMEFDPRDGTLRDEAAFIDPNKSAPNPIFSSRNDNLEVRLWKKIVTESEETDEDNAAIPNATYRNLVENDLLVDRMTLPESLEVPVESGHDEIEGTFSFPEDFDVVDGDGNRIRNDNSGVTIARWKTTRRSDSPTIDPPSKGQVTPWMLRSRTLPDSTQVSSASHSYPDAGNPFLPDSIADLTAEKLFDSDDITDKRLPTTIKPDFEIQPTLRAMWDLAITHTAIIQTLGLSPHLKSDVTFSGSPGTPGINEDDDGNHSEDKFPQLILNLPTMANLDATTGEPVPEIFVGGDHISKGPRLADLLLAWGIGPTYAPDPTRGVNTPEYHAEEWMTAPEAMAVALGVDHPAPSGTFDDADAIWKDAYDKTRTDNLLDFGRLSLDQYVPYLNFGFASEDPPEFTLGTDLIRGQGVPMALGVIDRARAIAPLARPNDPKDPVNDELVRLGLSRPTYGSINVNTAPVEVLRLLPGLTPSRTQYVQGTTSGQIKQEWWAKDYPDTELPDLDPALPLENPDIAAGIVAYRDRMYMTPNTSARPETTRGPGIDYGIAPMDLKPTDPMFLTQNMIGEIPLWDRTSPTTLPAFDLGLDRESFTGIEAIRQTPGFGSLGELLALRVNPAFESNVDAWSNLRPMSMQLLGYDGKAQGVDNSGSEPVTILSQIFDDDNAGTVIDGYDEKIAMANAVVNTLSVRSDFFAVWFVVQGFKESDVANLRPEDPLVPSYKKRFLMVIDRSNVVEPGDKPKILLLKEVPL